MKALWNELVENESGMILSAELILILTIAVLGMVTGLACVQQAVVSEFQDLAMAFRGLNQSYSTPYYRGCWKWWGGGRTSWSAGSGFIDFYDGCVGVNTGTAVQYGAVHEGCEINSGLGCGTSPLPSTVASPAVLAPQPVPVPASSPCHDCQSAPGVGLPAPMPQ